MKKLLFIMLWTASSLAFAEVSLDGVVDEIQSNIRQIMPLASLPCQTRASEVRRLYGQAQTQIREAMEPYGYYHPVIEDKLVFSDACWQASFLITPGPPVIIDQVDIQVNGPARVQSLITANAPKKGDTLRHEVYETFRDQLRRAVLDQGFLDARYTTQRVAVDPEQNTANLKLILAAGNQYRFGRISHDIEFLTNSLIDRLLTLKPGDPVNRRLLGRTQQELMQTGYFSEVEVSSTPDPSTSTLDVSIRGTANTLRDRSIGAGVSTDKGVYVTAGYSRALLNSKGHQINVELEASLDTRLFDFQSEYRVPGKEPRRDWRSFYAAANAQNTSDAIDARTYSLGVRESRSLDPWRIEPFLELTFERSDLDDADDANRALVPGVAFLYRNVNDSPRPTGIRARVEVAAATDAIFSKTSFLRLSGQVKTITALGPKFRLILRSEAGYLETSEFDYVPTNWRFFSGGDTSVRGFDYRSLGPRNLNGDTTGGEWLLTGSAEVDYPVRENWLASVFVDSGDVGFNGEKTEKWPFAVGLGVGWLSPVGPVRLAVAFPVQGSDETFRLHISLGPDL